MHSMETTGRHFSLNIALGESFSYVFSRYAEFAELSWKYFAASTLAGILVIALTYAYPADLTVYATAGTAAIILIMLLSIAYYIATTRQVLLSEQNPVVIPYFPATFVRFLLYTLATLLTLAVALAFAIAAGVLATLYWSDVDEATIDTATNSGIAVSILIWLGGVFYISGRICGWLVAPTIAKPLTLRESWRATSGAGLRILLGLLLIGIIFGLLDFVVEAIPPFVLGSADDMYELMFQGRGPLAVALAFAAKVAIYLIQIALFAAYAGSVYRQTSS
jgi:hypothetical protein